MNKLITTIVGFFYGLFLCSIGYSIVTWQYWVIMAFTVTLIGLCR